MSKTVLQAINLQKEFTIGKENSNRVIPELNLEIKEGEFVVIMGSSGSGKSTLLYLLAGLDDPSGGEVLVNGERMPDSPRDRALFRRESMGIIFQQNNLIPGLTLLENILVAGLLVQKNQKAARNRTTILMNNLGIGDYKDRFPAQISGGEKQRASIARALVNDPKILLADEPTGSLNSAATTNVLQTLARLHEQGHTIIMVTHEIEAACYGQRILYLRDGEIVDEFRIDKTSNKENREQALLDWLTDKGW